MGRSGCGSTGGSSGPRSNCSSPRPNEALGIRDMRLFLDPDRGGLRLSRHRPVAAWAVHLERADPAAQGRAGDDRHCRAGCRRNVARGALRSRSGRVHRAARRRRRRARRDARLPPGRRRPADRGASCRATMSASPGRRRSRPRRAARRHDPARRGPDHARRHGVGARACSQGAIEPRAAHRQRQAGQRLGPGPRGARRARAAARSNWSRVANVTPDRISVTGRGQVDRRPLILDSPAVLTRGGGRLGDRADAGALRRRARDAVGPHRRPPRTSRRHRRPCRCNCSTSSGPRLGLGGIASGRIDYRWAGAAVRARQSARPRPAAAPGWCWRRSRSTSGIAAVLDGRQGGDARGGGQRRQDHRPRAGPLRAARPRADRRRAGQCADADAAALRRAGRHAVAPVGGRDCSTCRGRSRSAPTSAAGWSIRRSADRSRPTARGSKARSPAWWSSKLQRQRPLQRVAAGAERDQRRRPRAAAPSAGSGTVDFSGGAPALDLKFDASRARLLDRDDIRRRRSPARSPSARAGGGGTISGNLRLDSGRFTLGRAQRRVARAAAAGAPCRPRRRRSDRARASSTPWKLDVELAGGDLTVRGLGIDSRWTTDLAIGGTARCAALHRPRRPHPRQL